MGGEYYVTGVGELLELLYSARIHPVGDFAEFRLQGSEGRSVPWIQFKHCKEKLGLTVKLELTSDV